MSLPPSHRPDDDQRLTDWVRQHGAAVRGYLFGVVRRDDLADDLAQDVFRRAWQARDAYREQGQSRAYLLRIADRIACDYLRRSRPEVNLDDDGWEIAEPAAGDASPLEWLEKSEAAAQLGLALDRLSPLQRRVLLLRFYGDFEFAEIAGMLNCPLNTALSHCHRALGSLRKWLAAPAVRRP